MEKTLQNNGPVQNLLNTLILRPDINNYQNILSLSGNELTNLLLNITGHIRKETPINELFDRALKIIGESGIGEGILLFQFNEHTSIASLTHSWSSPYTPSINPVGMQIDVSDSPMFEFFKNSSGRSTQIDDTSKYLSLPNYIFKNKYKAFFMKLKSKSMLISTGSADKVKIAIALLFSSRNVVWSNEVEKLLQSVVDQLVLALEQCSEKVKKETLERNIIFLQEKALREKEDLLRQFASDVHDLPCSVIPSLKESIKRKDFSEAERLVDELYNDLRQLINEYVVPDVDLLSFGSNIYQFVNGFKKSFKGEVFIELPDEEINFSKTQAIELFKVIKEWFCNIEKHSQATEVNLEIKKLNDLFYLITIKDNGIGFNTNESKNFGYGLLNIRRRLTSIGGKHEIHSKLGKGSTLKIQISHVVENGYNS